MIDLAPVILQMCDPSKGFVEYLSNFEFWKAVTCPYASSVGFLTLGLFVYGSISVPIYLTTGSIIVVTPPRWWGCFITGGCTWHDDCRVSPPGRWCWWDWSALSEI